MAYLEQSLEGTLVDALTAVSGTVPVYGYLTPASERKRTCTLVKTSPRKQRSTNIPVTDVEATVTVMASAEDCDSSDLLAQMADPICNKLESLEKDIDATSDALSTDTYRVDGFQFSGGESPAYDQQALIWYMVLQCTFSGVILYPAVVETGE